MGAKEQEGGKPAVFWFYRVAAWRHNGQSNPFTNLLKTRGKYSIHQNFKTHPELQDHVNVPPGKGGWPEERETGAKEKPKKSGKKEGWKEGGRIFALLRPPTKVGDFDAKIHAPNFEQ